MKVTKIAGTSAVAALVGLTFGAATNAHATLSPLANNASDLQPTTAGVVGWATPNANGGSKEAELGQDMLYINNGGSLSSLPYSFSGETFNNNTAGAGGTVLSYGGGTVSTVGANQNGSSSKITSGYDFVIAKYGGPGGGGYILYYLGGESVELPQFSYDLWGNNASQYQISDYTEFDVTGNTTVHNGGGVPVPEPSTVFAASLLLLPLGISTLRVLRKARA